jgi:hypothetical protein
MRAQKTGGDGRKNWGAFCLCFLNFTLATPIHATSVEQSLPYFFYAFGRSRTAEGGHSKRNQDAVMRYTFENAKTALEGLLML